MGKFSSVILHLFIYAEGLVYPWLIWNLFPNYLISVRSMILLLILYFRLFSLLCRVRRTHHRYFLLSILGAVSFCQFTIEIIWCTQMNIWITAEIEIHYLSWNPCLLLLIISLGRVGISMLVAVKRCCSRVTRWSFGMRLVANRNQGTLLGVRTDTIVVVWHTRAMVPKPLDKLFSFIVRKSLIIKDSPRGFWIRWASKANFLTLQAGYILRGRYRQIV